VPFCPPRLRLPMVLTSLFNSMAQMMRFCLSSLHIRGIVNHQFYLSLRPDSVLTEFIDRWFCDNFLHFYPPSVVFDHYAVNSNFCLHSLRHMRHFDDLVDKE